MKIKYDIGIADSDIRFQDKTVMKLTIFAFLGGWVSGALGLGGGAIFNPLLLSMGVPPKVSSATGMFMIMFSTTGSSLVYILYRMLNVQYAIWIGAWCTVGSYLGITVLDKINKRLNR